MSDVAPGLHDKIQQTFRSNLASNRTVASIAERIASGNANYTDAGNYAEAVGDCLSGALKKNLTVSNLPDGTMYWNIAERAVRPFYEEEYRMASDAATTVQKSLNTKAGIGLNAKTAKLDADSLDEIMDMYCAADYEGSIEQVLETAEYFARQTVDKTLKENEEFQYQCGKHPRVIRRASAGCCEWCAEREGTYEYPNVPDEVYDRHDYCKCSVDYDPGDNSGRVQDVYSKNWMSEAEAEVLEDRKTYNVKRTYGSDGLKIKNRNKGSSVDTNRLKTLNRR